jgi:S1-C subfamily serine protease
MTGFRVTSVYPGSSAEKAGVRVGDLILAVDQEKLTASEPQHYEELSALIRQYRIGDKPAISIRRGQENVTISVELVQSPKLAREMKEYLDENFDLTVREMGFFDRARELLGDTQPGVLVTEVKSGGWAAVANINVGDVITAVDGSPIDGIDAFERKMKELAGKKPAYVVMQVLRKIYTVYIEVELNWNAVSGGKGQQ